MLYMLGKPSARHISDQHRSTNFHNLEKREIMHLGYPLEDQSWIGKLAIGSLILFIPIFGGIVWMGYIVEIIRRVSSGSDTKLPDWSNMGNYLSEGIVGFAALIGYMAPGSILIALLYVLFGGSRDATQVVGTGLGFLFFAYMLVVAIVFAISTIRYAATGEVGSYTELRATFSLISEHSVAIITTTLALIIGLVGVWLASFVLACTICGPILALSYFILVFGGSLGSLAIKLDLTYSGPDSSDLNLLT